MYDIQPHRSYAHQWLHGNAFYADQVWRSDYKDGDKVDVCFTVGTKSVILDATPEDSADLRERFNIDATNDLSTVHYKGAMNATIIARQPLNTDRTKVSISLNASDNSFHVRHHTYIGSIVFALSFA